LVLTYWCRAGLGSTTLEFVTPSHDVKPPWSSARRWLPDLRCDGGVVVAVQNIEQGTVMCLWVLRVAAKW